MSKYGFISGPYFPVFGMNTERWLKSSRESCWKQYLGSKTSMDAGSSEVNVLPCKWQEGLLNMGVLHANINLKQSFQEF